ncbi:MAG TPA: hypothetical protein VI756_30055 [Blastocatellia bacterium]
MLLTYGNPEAKRVSRRTFLKAAAGGVVGAAFMDRSRSGALGAAHEAGTITLDALMLSYIGAVPGTGGASVFKQLKGYSTIFNLGVPGIEFIAALTANQADLVFYEQAASKEVPGALELTPAFGTDLMIDIGAGPPGNSALYLFLGPKFKLKGTPEALQFHLAGSIKAVAIEISGLLANPSADNISQDTAASLSSQYVSNVGDLVAPRYQPPTAFSAGGTSETLIFSTEDFGTETAQASATATIIDQTGFTSSTLKNALAVGSNVTITYSSGFDRKSARVLSLEITPGDMAFSAYLDNVFKSVVLAPTTD